MKLSLAYAGKAGAAAASGRSGKSARRLDLNTEAAFVRNQNMIAQNLMTAEEARDYTELGIQDRHQGLRNQAFGEVAVAPTIPLEIPEPIQNAGPSSAGMMLGIGNSIIGGIGSITKNMPPNIGNFGGGGNVGLGTSNLNFSAPTPLTSGMNSSELKLWKYQTFNINQDRSHLT